LQKPSPCAGREKKFFAMAVRRTGAGSGKKGGEVNPFVQIRGLIKKKIKREISFDRKRGEEARNKTYRTHYIPTGGKT